MSGTLARWILQSQGRAAIAAAALSLLVFLTGGVFTAWVPGAVLSLLVLSGHRQWLPACTIAAALPVVAVIGNQAGIPAGVGVAAMFLLPALGLAAWLRKTNSLSYTAQVAAIAGIAMVLLAHRVIDDSAAFWQPVIAEMQRVLQQSGSDSEVAKEFAEAYGRVAWGVVTWLVMLHALVSVFVGVHLLGRARGSHELGPRFRALRLGRVLAVLAAVALVMATFRVARESDDVLSVLVGVFMLQGLAILHAARQAFGLGGWALVVVYVGLFLPPFTAVVSLFVVLAGWLDNWLDFRARWAPPTPPVAPPPPAEGG